MNDGIVACRKCRTPHHLECWRYVGVCTTYGCQGREYDALRSARDEVLVIEDEKLPPQAQWAARLVAGARETRSKDHFVWKVSQAGLRCELHCLRLGSDWTFRFLAALDRRQEERVRRRLPPPHLSRSLGLNGVMVLTPLTPPSDEAGLREFLERCREEAAAAGLR